MKTHVLRMRMVNRDIFDAIKAISGVERTFENTVYAIEAAGAQAIGLADFNPGM